MTVTSIPAVDFEDLRATFEKLKKNEEALGAEINAPKYAKALAKIKKNAVDQMFFYYLRSLYLMATVPSKENDVLDELRHGILEKDVAKLKSAYERRDANTVFELAKKAHEKDFDNWLIVYHPTHGNDFPAEPQIPATVVREINLGTGITNNIEAKVSEREVINA